MLDPLTSPKTYQAFLYGLQAHYPAIRRSTLTYVPTDTLFGYVEGLLIFDDSVILCVQEYLNFELGVIEGYGYEVSRSHNGVSIEAELPDAAEYCKAHYSHKDKLYWYDSFPHPNDPALALTMPHHKHIHPDIKHHRISAPGLSFTEPNLPFLIQEIEQLL